MGTAAEALEVQVHLFLEKNSIFNNIVHAHMMATSVWSDVKTPEDPLPLITKPVTNLLTEIAGYAAQAFVVDYRLESVVTYKNLSAWAKVMLSLSVNDTRTSSVSMFESDWKKSSKILSFLTSTGDKFQGDEYIQKFESTFQSSAMSEFLENRHHCNDN